jgi:hypothetical protein
MSTTYGRIGISSSLEIRADPTTQKSEMKMTDMETSSNPNRAVSPSNSKSERVKVGFEELLDLREAASLLGMHWKTLERRAQSGKVPAYRVFWPMAFSRFRFESLGGQEACY